VLVASLAKYDAELTREMKKIQSKVGTRISVLKKWRETEVEKNDERDVFQVYYETVK
jgi:hypothetical protein